MYASKTNQLLMTGFDILPILGTTVVTVVWFFLSTV